MKSIISRLSDKALSALLREETAGACIPEQGKPCTNSYCSSSGAWYTCSSTYSCTGACSCTPHYTQNRC
ncbi:hypothetical protein Caci_3753 [Catenulispora acidiphila DSM 44928]|jgi:hypothetical protein|uniref:Uncharacterized protein n=1 Tax=Catenulispora acidiphila (strain DSM 44928 / JCM 14897 / NBRC 102108 / NRRL B-24433 / ID139908) TaxID=479433 RepID=C7QC36_CATAD|nr:hypothetical protein [Catenulispora acidiphila]ACU72655.1 hypothetical protein Caci_3753 [Catenulispora acidiphila DSM 44928]